MVSPLERMLRRDRLILAGLLTLLTLLSWISMAGMAGQSPHGRQGLLPCCASFGLVFWMWVVMMAGMMIPSVAPMVLAHAGVARRRAALGAPYVSSGLFLAGYLAAWSGFSLLAALAQWTLHGWTFLDPATLSLRPLAGSAVLLCAGAFQLSKAKNACLSQCRAPMGYFLTEWREGRIGALAMGLHHGTSCIGCCWLLMAILFAAGVMNLWWGVAITLFVIAEKLLPWGRWVVRSGAVLCFVGAALLLARALT